MKSGSQGAWVVAPNTGSGRADVVAAPGIEVHVLRATPG